MKTKNLLIVALCLASTMSFSQIKSLGALMTPEQKEAEAKQKEAQKAKEAVLEAYFGGRPSSPGPEVASDKQNIPAKKETFASKLERYKAEGFKVAVTVTSEPIKTIPQDPNDNSQLSSRNIMLAGSLPSIKEEIMPLVESFVDALNKEFNTDVFEIVDMSIIPYNEGKWGKTDDWGSTKYKMVIFYNAQAQYSYEQEGTNVVSKESGDFSGFFRVNLAATAAEYVYDKKKGFKIKYIVRVGGLGTYKSGVWKAENAPGLKSIEELQQVVNPLTGADLIAELQKEQDASIAKYIEKRKK